jgi:hypothetical protein
MRTTIWERLKSWAVWVAVASQVLSILVLLEVISPTQSDKINTLIGYLLQVGVAFGFINNPADPNKL